MFDKVFPYIFLPILFLSLGAFSYYGYKDLETFKDKCNKLGGSVVSGRGPSLCVKSGLIVDHE